MHAYRVLVVDDDADVRRSLRLVFERHRYAVHEAHDIEAGMRAAQAHHPDIVLLGLGLTGDVDGAAVKLREPADGARPFVCALTRGESQGHGHRAREAVFDAYILTDADLDGLVALIKRVSTLRGSEGERGELGG